MLKMDKAKIERALEIIQGASEAYRLKERDIFCRAVGGHAAYMGWWGDKVNHKKYFYWNYFGGKNKEYSCLNEGEAKPLPFLMPEEIMEVYALSASKNPELVVSGVIGQAISVLVENSWKGNKFKFFYCRFLKGTTLRIIFLNTL